MIRSRLAVAALAVPLFLLGGASVAIAAPAAQATGWVCDGDVCVRYTPASDVTPLDVDRCDRETCISVRGNAGGYSAIGFADDEWYGHVDLWGPGMPNHNSGDHRRPTTSGAGRGAGTACALGWEALGGGNYRSRGNPCVGIS